MVLGWETRSARQVWGPVLEPDQRPCMVGGRAEATDVANAVLDGVDGILLGAETLRGSYPLQTVQTVLSIARSAEAVFDHELHFETLMDGAEVQSPTRSPHAHPHVQMGLFWVPWHQRLSLVRAAWPAWSMSRCWRARASMLINHLIVCGGSEMYSGRKWQEHQSRFQPHWPYHLPLYALV